ncbi:helix-turn-helix domain-containing protein [Streptomyces sp. NPDC048462]|uniref:MmyB family transcriptional regulator n=1 Tax=Streptomyces sp. NPDC048462 TaxID=3365555 RepID=UPI00371819D5
MTTMATVAPETAGAAANTTPAAPEASGTTTTAETAATFETSETDIRRHELADFLRSRRERITPEQVGLVRGRRRRTPGLRREEVAQLSAVGVTWYTWLEQARDIQVSPQVLDALARALLLDRSERSHLFSLAGAIDPAPGTDCPSITPALRAMLRQLEPIPACVQNSRYDVLAHNRTYGRLLCELDAVAPEDRNIMLLAYTNEQWRSTVMDIAEVTRFLTAKFRAAMAEHLADPAWKALLKRLESASPEFRETWARHEVVGSGGRSKVFRNRYVGLLRLETSDLWLGPAAGPRLVTYVPRDEETQERLQRLQALVLADED